ncbi:MAG: HTTM domain-containing protein [Archangiaceae bacterium]|nr:HTTM domain-containing protein [Archangiaceae bacterium]
MGRAPEPVFTFNAKSLALGRVSIAALLLIDLGVRFSSLEAHYSDAGALPRDAYTLSQWDQAWSLHLLSGATGFEGALFALTALALVAFGAGFHARLANAVAWLLYLSLCARNPLLRDGQDELGRLLLFFCLFLPLERRPRGEAVVPLVRSPGTVAFTAQVLLVYWSSVVHKLQSPWWTSLQALENVAHMRRYQTGFAQWLAQYPSLLELGTVGALAIEALGPLCLVLFWRRPRWRVGVVVAMSALHLGMWSMIRIGTFPALCVATWLMFLPAAVWRKPTSPAPAPDRFSRLALGGLALAALLCVQNVLHFALPAFINVPARALGLQQWWGVFAPTKAEGHVSDGWLWAQGRTAAGALVTVDVPWFTSSVDPPPMLRWADVRWRHLFANLTVVGWPANSAQGHTQALARTNTVRWMCRQWNREHPDQRLSQLYVFFFRHRLGETAPVTRELLGSGDEACSD